MKQLFITEVEQSLLSILDNAQLLEMFLSAKRVKGCSEKTLHYYQTTIAKLLHTIDRLVLHHHVCSLADYQQVHLRQPRQYPPHSFQEPKIMDDDPDCCYNEYGFFYAKESLT